MAKFKVLKAFQDIETDEIYSVDQEIDMTVKRAKEVEKNLDDSFLEKVEESDQEEIEESDQEEVEAPASEKKKAAKKK
ncbi:MAG: hypothetical protein L0F96_07050 [Lactococcus lactis]|nr:hypothetical protein [Lactococcus lactis]MDN5440962.1 hypothetical protein [Lactococcus lactis]